MEISEQPQLMDNLEDKNLDSVKDDLSMENEKIAGQSGSETLGKFKSVESLYKAYNELQKEFTKKSQELSAIKSKLDDKVETPKSKDELIDEKIEEFIKNCPKSVVFKQNFKENLQKDENFDSKNLFEIYANLLENNSKSAVEYSVDENFLNDYIYSNEKIREHIVKDYIQKIKNITPVKLSNSNLSSISILPPNQPKTVSEAGKIAKSIIKQI